jgi:hypothetical protein
MRVWRPALQSAALLALAGAPLACARLPLGTSPTDARHSLATDAAPTALAVRANVDLSGGGLDVEDGSVHVAASPGGISAVGPDATVNINLGGGTTAGGGGSEPSGERSSSSLSRVSHLGTLGTFLAVPAMLIV